MSRRLSVIAAAFVKDLRLLWPLAALTAAVIATQSLYNGDTEMAVNYLPLVASLATGFFVLALVHQDAPASLRHDWLTRPIGRIDLLLAKILLATAVVLFPAALGSAISAVRDGASVPEAWLTALGAAGRIAIVGFSLLVVAAVTSSLLEAVGVLVGLFLLFVFVPPIVRQISGVDEAVLFTGSGWVITGALGLILLVGGLIILWLQYAGRRTGSARAAFAGTLSTMALTLTVLNWDAVFAVQKALTRDDPTAQRVTLVLTPQCFEAEIVDPASPGVEARDGPWTADGRRAAGFGAVGFRTGVNAEGLPDGWRTSFIHVQARYVDRRGKTIHRLEPARIMPEWRTMADGRLEVRHAWLLSHARLSKLLRQRADLRLDYKLALLAPARIADIPVDGRTWRIANLGSCTAHAQPGTAVIVRCFTAGSQPDLIAARMADAPPDREVAGTFPDFAPDVLKLSAGRHQMILPRSAGDGPPRVTITLYEARAYIARTIPAPGLTGSPPSCPMTRGR